MKISYADENQGLDLGQAQHFDGVKPVSGIPTLNGCYSNSFYNTDYNILFSLLFYLNQSIKY
jgi:hypothetical protein